MLLTDLIQRFRDLADDLQEPYLWSTALVTNYADQAENEACSRRPLLTSSTNASLCEIAVTSGTALYSRHTATRDVYYAKFVTTADTETYELEITNLDELTYKDEAWEEKEGPATHLLLTDSQVQITPAPTEDGTLYMSVSHVPLEPMSEQTGDAEPTIDVAHHEHLIYWMLHLGFLKRDVDTFNANKALDYEGRFAVYFGDPKGANALKSVRTVRTTRLPTQGGWI